MRCCGSCSIEGRTGHKWSPDGRTLFFNIFGRARADEPPTEGMTIAVTGAWGRGCL